MDYLQELSRQLGGKIDTQELYNLNFSEPSYRNLTAKDYEGYKIKVDEFGELFSVKIKIESEFTISINNPNKLSSIDNLLNSTDTPYNIYIWRESYSEFILGHQFDPFLSEEFSVFWKQFISKINELGLSENETVSIRVDRIDLILTSNRDLIPIIEEIIALINNNPLVFSKFGKEKIFKKNIPENLRSLIPLLKKWSIPDDSEREQLMEETSEKQKKKLVKIVWPYMVEINQFLDSFGDQPLSYEAILLGNLAELVSELSI